MKIYLAGKIAKNDWRSAVVPNIADAELHLRRADVLGHWSARPTIWPGLECTGPFFAAGCDHGCSHGAGTHGQGRDGRYEGDAYFALSRRQTFQQCMRAIADCDIFFAWFGEEDTFHATTAYGTLVEIGYATAHGKPVYIGTDMQCADLPPWSEDCGGGHGCTCGHDDLWFARQCATLVEAAPDPRGALEMVLAHSADLRDQEQRKLLESPLEVAFFDAYCKVRPPSLGGLVAQHKVTANGKNYRLDFALPDRKIAFEMDGRTYHDTDVAFIRDRRRDLDLELAGWRVHRFDGDLIRANPANVVAIAAKLAGAAA